MDQVLEQDTGYRTQDPGYGIFGESTGTMNDKNKPSSSFVDLIVWQKAHTFVLEAYNLSGTFPKSEVFGLTSQFRRASVSIPANIAESFRKRSTPDTLRYLNISHSSLEECRYYLILINDLGYGRTNSLQSLLEEVSKLLTAYTAAIKRNAK